MEQHKKTDNIHHARRSAHWFAKAAAEALGIAQGRQIILLDGAATAPAIKQGLARIQDGASEGGQVYFYCSGRGLRAPAQDNAPQVIAFMDTCFTGVTDGASVFKDEPTTRLTPKQLKPPRNGKLAMLTACNAKQHPNVYGAKGHRLFSYFLIRELLKSDHATIVTLNKKVAANVTSTTTNLGDRGEQQDPMLQGNRSLEL